MFQSVFKKNNAEIAILIKKIVIFTCPLKTEL